MPSEDGHSLAMSVAPEVPDAVEHPLVFPVAVIDSLALAVPNALAIIATDVEGTVTVWNDYASVLYGWTVAEAVGRSIGELTVGPVTNAVAEEIMDRLRSGVHWAGTFEARRRSGELVRVNVLDSPLIDDAGQVVGIVGFSREDANQMERSLNELDELRELAGRLDEVRREEARRIAGQVHDEFSQRLHLLIQRTSRLAGDASLSEEARGALGELLDVEQELVLAMRGVAGSLRPPLLDELGVTAALEHLVDSFGALGMAVELTVDPVVDDLDGATAEVLVAIMQEALSNVLAHAGADSCWAGVGPSGDADVVVLEVTDDGCGYAGGVGFGLRLMRERARRAGGMFEIGPRDGGGTRLLVRLPMSGGGGGSSLSTLWGQFGSGER